MRPAMRHVRAWMVGGGLPLVVAVGACGPSDVTGDHATADRTATGVVSGALIVFAAASLTDAFDALAAAFVDDNPQVTVVANHAGSQTVARQIHEGAPADVFASADTTHMDALAAAGRLAGGADVFATNSLAIAVEPGNPLGITGLEDLSDPRLVLVLPADEVPAGRYARQVLDAAGLVVSPASWEQDVRAALSKVALGEADAAIVFASDLVAARGRADGVAIPAADNVTATYPIAILADAPNPTAAEAFVAFVRSDAGQDILAAHGFAAP